MFNSTVLEVAIGFVFCFATVALIASSVYEGIASLFKLRAGSLLAGVQALLNDPKFVGLARAVYNHALVNPTDSGTTQSGKPPILPSYIDSKHFALALIDSIQKVPGTFEALKAQIDVVENLQLRQLLQGMYARADGDLTKFQAQLANWFDAGMMRVSGGYKRQAQLCTFLFALAIAGAFNIDAFHLFQSLWAHPAVMAQISAVNPANAGEALTELRVLPLGWSAFTWLSIPGWVVTASSVLFGAPFWFDLLQRLINLRGTGPRPDAARDKTPH